MTFKLLEMYSANKPEFNVTLCLSTHGAPLIKLEDWN